MATKLDTIKLALALLGEPSVASETATDHAVVVTALWEVVARQQQAAFDWPELLRRATLTGTPHATLDGWYTFTEPTELLRIVSSNYPCRREAGAIIMYVGDNWTGAVELEVVYIRYSSTPNESAPQTAWSEALRHVVAYHLAAQAAPAITRNPERAALAQQTAREQTGALWAQIGQDAVMGRAERMAIPGRHAQARNGWSRSDLGRLR